MRTARVFVAGRGSSVSALPILWLSAGPPKSSYSRRMPVVRARAERQRGIGIHEGAQVTGLIQSSGRISGVQKTAAALQAGIVSWPTPKCQSGKHQGFRIRKTPPLRVDVIGCE
jgi:hypothetical protein